jgi:hypothetical protein
MRIETADRVARIRDLNDKFRQSFAGGVVLLTQGVLSLDEDLREEILSRVRTFNCFTKDNDPNGEHDFGSFDIFGKTYFWKMDYYDRIMRHGSQDPADPNKTTRVLTVMLATEY